MKLYYSFLPIVLPIYMFHTSIYLTLSVSLLLDSEIIPVHLTHCVYLYFLTVDPCIFVAYYYSSASPIHHVTKFRFQA